MMRATLLDPNQPNQCSTASPVRARGRQIRAPKKHIFRGLSRGSYSDNVTVRNLETNEVADDGGMSEAYLLDKLAEAKDAAGLTQL